MGSGYSDCVSKRLLDCLGRVFAKLPLGWELCKWINQTSHNVTFRVVDENGWIVNSEPLDLDRPIFTEPERLISFPRACENLNTAVYLLNTLDLHAHPVLNTDVITDEIELGYLTCLDVCFFSSRFSFKQCAHRYAFRR